MIPLALSLVGLQALLMFVDERVFHRERSLGLWESWGHVADSSAFAAVLLGPALALPSPLAVRLYAAGAVASTLLVAKDEWIHARECGGAEQWVHALLFVLHPCVLFAVGSLWISGQGAGLRLVLPFAALALSFYQWAYWIGASRALAEDGPLVDNEFYDELGTKWHEGDAHAIALLRAETPVRLAYIRDALRAEGLRPGANILDVGCGGGFLANPLGADGYRVKGLDRSQSSLDAARAQTPAGADVTFESGDALRLNEQDGVYDAVLLMDLLEHLDEPARAVAEAARVLKPGGLVFFHTFNRTPESWLLAVKGIGLVTHEGPANVHCYSMFITPEELSGMGGRHGLRTADLRGIRPVLAWPFFWSLLRRRVHPDFAFRLSDTTRVGYLGRFVKSEAAVLGRQLDDELAVQGKQLDELLAPAELEILEAERRRHRAAA